MDDPTNRNGYYPAKFKPKENPFYCALPYNDFTADGYRKTNVYRIYWWRTKNWGPLESWCKNRWIRITKGARTAYAQWEDVGPGESDDINYVFGTSRPRNRGNHAGLDVSPAVRDYLGLSDLDTVSWQFVDASAVPAGPWSVITTTSQICWQ